MLGRLWSSTALRSSVALARTHKPTLLRHVRSINVSADAQRVYTQQGLQEYFNKEEVEPEERPLEFIEDTSFGKYNIPKTEQNIPLLKAYDLIREAENLIILATPDAFTKAEAILIGVLDLTGRNGITNAWCLGSAHANLAHVLHHNFKYESAMNNYAIGLKYLSQEPVKDSWFLGLRQLGFAELLSLIGHHEMASSVCQAAVLRLEKGVGPTDALVGLALSNLATYYQIQGKLELAVVHAERSFKLLVTVLGKHNETTRNCATNLANIYKALERTSDLAALDASFLTDDQPVLPPKVGRYDPAYLEDLQKKWYKMGPRAIFDPPGLHRSADLSANSYKAFLDQWKAHFPLDASHASVITAELKSVGYSFNKLPRYRPRKLVGAQDAPEKLQHGFEHLNIQGVTSLAEQLDKEAKLPPLTSQDITITGDEWSVVAKRQAEHRAKHGDPMHEAIEDEFARSEDFFIDKAPKVDPTAKLQTVAAEDTTYLQEDEAGFDWDGDTYDPLSAVLGTEEEQAFERSKSADTPRGVGLDPNSNEAAKARLAAKEAFRVAQQKEAEELEEALEEQPFNEDMEEEYNEMVRAVEGEEKVGANNLPASEVYDAAQYLKGREERFWTGPSGEVEGTEEYEETEAAKTDEAAESAEVTETAAMETGASAKTAGVEKGAEKERTGTVGPYEHNPDEDDVFPEHKKDRTINKDAHKSESELAATPPKRRFGRLHDTPWHDDWR